MSVLLAITLIFHTSDICTQDELYTTAYTGQIQTQVDWLVPTEVVMPRYGEDDIRGVPSIGPEQIDTILQRYNSPAAGTGNVWYTEGIRHNIDPAYAVAFFLYESTGGTHPNWKGLKPDGSTTHNVGNIICAGYETCYRGMRDYPDWTSGIVDWYTVISRRYVDRGITKLPAIVYQYAPPFENDTERLIRNIRNIVERWRDEAHYTYQREGQLMDCYCTKTTRA